MKAGRLPAAVRYRIVAADGRWLAGSRDLAQLRRVLRPGERICRVRVVLEKRPDGLRVYNPSVALVDPGGRAPTMSRKAALRSLRLNGQLQESALDGVTAVISNRESRGPTGRVKM